MAVVVEDRLAAVGAVLPAADGRPRLALGAVEDLVHRLHDRLAAIVLDQREQTALAHARRADHRPQIAHEVVRVAHVGRDHLQHVVAQLAGVVELERRDPQPLLPDLGRARVVGAVRGAADVRLMGAVDRPEGHLPVHEDRHEGGEVRQVVVAVVRIVQEEDVARPHARAEEVTHGLHRPRDGAHVDRHVLGLGDEPRLAVADRGGEVTAGVEDLRVRRAQHRLAHLLDDGGEAMRQDRDGDRIEHAGSIRGVRERRRPRECGNAAGPPRARRGVDGLR